MSSDSAITRPFRSVYRFFGAFFDAVHYFIATLVNPTRPRGRLTDQPRSNGPRIGYMRPPGSGGNAPNMTIGGCRSCAM